MIVTERALQRVSLCPMLVPMKTSNLESCAYALAEKVIRQSFEGKLPVLEDIRKQFTDLWNSAWYLGIDRKLWRTPPLKVGDPYWAGIHLGRTISFRVFSLVLDYEVMHPEQPYNLILNGYTIQGRYALLRKRKGARVPSVLVLHMQSPAMKHEHSMPPDPISLARYVDMKMGSFHKDVHVLHYPLVKGKEWLNKHVDEPLAKDYLHNMIKVVLLNPRYPAIGSHCADCETRPCMEVYSIGR